MPLMCNSNMAESTPWPIGIVHFGGGEAVYRGYVYAHDWMNVYYILVKEADDWEGIIGYASMTFSPWGK